MKRIKKGCIAILSGIMILGIPMSVSAGSRSKDWYLYKKNPNDYVLNSVLALDFYSGNYTVKCSSLSGDSSQVINYGCESHTVISSGERRFSSPGTQYIQIKPSFWSSNNVTATFKVTLDANSSGYSTGTISI